jgi:hypothetical protein
VPDLYPVVDVSDWELVENEVLGANPKSWVRSPGSGRDRQGDWLFKPVVVPTSTGHRQGEDWAEKIVSELGGLLGVPCAVVELASRAGVRGSISRNVVPPGWDRVLGSELLAATEPSYRGPFLGSDGRERRPRGRPGHSPTAIAAALARCSAPPGSGLPNGLTAFAGYILLDAWVANQDRHDQNWAVLRSAVAPLPHVLAPSYDHASSVGFNLTDEKRGAELARAGGVSHFVARARADRFEHDPEMPKSQRPTLVEMARRFLRQAGPEAENLWYQRLEHVDSVDIERIVGSVPGLSEVTRTFVVELLRANRGRLLDVR